MKGEEAYWAGLGPEDIELPEELVPEVENGLWPEDEDECAALEGTDA